ncbi:hypothetical protein JXB11_01095 [Candidatus Woesearchaeota archaeon]|nr:hypothetical protein [Candidatus Woesearchaeota archaeon]
MHILLHRLEKRVDEIIPLLLILLLGAIIVEIFFHELAEAYGEYIDLLDGIIIIIFSADLCFKYHRVRNIPKFIKKHWLEIIAVFPFFLIFRFMEFFRAPELLQTGQEILHEGVELEREAARASRLAKEGAAVEKEAAAIVNEAGKASRAGRMLRYFRALSRTPRFISAAIFYEKPTGKHHPHEKKKK